ncbi:hypothetical protein WJX73_009300 [Symbiochloris irregularis]|uniref:PH domain-containing protein n=1 Tax=Symbiochloris irregularis TaxID=706552 RepID=A0AAW1NWC9_9CHLO
MAAAQRDGLQAEANGPLEGPLQEVNGITSTDHLHSTLATGHAAANQTGRPPEPLRGDSQEELDAVGSLQQESQSRLHFEVDSPPGSGATSPIRRNSRDDFGGYLAHQFAAGARKFKSAVGMSSRTERVSFMDLAQNPRLAAKARAELDPLGFAVPGGASSNGNTHANGREGDLERQSAAVNTVVADATEESRINAELAAQLTLRMQASRRALERLLGILQAMAKAEGAYVNVMRAVSHVNLVGDCDGSAMRAAMQRFSDLPYIISEGHGAVQSSLLEVTRGVQDVVNLVRKEATGIGVESQRSTRAVTCTRHSLETTFAEHQRACRAADALAALHHSTHTPPAGKAAAAAALMDPWLTEARCVTAQAALASAQQAERALLTGSLSRVRTLEARRADVMRVTIDAFLNTYSGGLVPLTAQAPALESLAGQVSAEDDLAELLASATAAQQTVQTLAQRQAAALEDVTQELLASPEILRQGEMWQWATGEGKWRERHCVLTRAGFLHCLASMGESLPVDSVALAQAAFITGDAPEFQLIETLAARVAVFSRERVLRYKAPCVEDCCEWAISLREGIAAARGP